MNEFDYDNLAVIFILLEKAQRLEKEVENWKQWQTLVIEFGAKGIIDGFLNFYWCSLWWW